jgi:hypothetical protein
MSHARGMTEAAKLRLRLQMNARLRLEVLAALSRVFREYRDPVSDELLSAVVLAVPEELLGEAAFEQAAAPPETPRPPGGKLRAETSPPETPRPPGGKLRAETSPPETPRTPGWKLGAEASVPQTPRTPGWKLGAEASVPQTPRTPGWKPGAETSVPQTPRTPGWNAAATSTSKVARKTSQTHNRAK